VPKHGEDVLGTLKKRKNSNSRLLFTDANHASYGQLPTSNPSMSGTSQVHPAATILNQIRPSEHVLQPTLDSQDQAEVQKPVMGEYSLPADDF
jgi:hypothetical protein